ncbi:MAG: Tn3 family transposase [Anaerolineae bacterium]|nr:Tn3 family transposase [Anaerolineae bacterium]
MARNTVLTQHQREQVMGFPHPDETRLIARSYLFSEQDTKIIRQQDSESNQFAFALHLCVLRYPGRVWQINEQLPEYLINLVADQLTLSPDLLDGSQDDPHLRREQFRRLRQQFGFRLFNDTTKQLLRDWMLPTALSTNKAIVLMNLLLSKMRQEQIIIPALSSLENFLHGIIQETSLQIYQVLTSALCTTLLAGAINLGVEKMALVSHHANYDRLAWIIDWFIRDDTYAKALAQLTHFQMSNPFSYYWGSGRHSSSDAQYFPTGNYQSAMTSHNPYYGKESGIAFYTHVSDQHSPFFTQVISTRVREAPYMLNGLLHHETQLDIHQHATDTKGFTDHVFALYNLLGFRFAPRIRGFSKLKLYPIKHKKYYPTLKPMLGARINTRLVYEDWLDMLHITSSLRLGTVTPPVFLQRLAQYPRQNRWAKTLKEIGRLEQTFFSLYWIQDKLLRQQVHQALFKGKTRNALSWAVCIYRLGRIHDRSLQDQQYRASALNLVVSAITLWNTIYIEKAVEHLRNKGWEITDKHLEHLTPLGWEHISLTGDYIWNPTLSMSLTNLRDLRT